jgi:hypothetical protein
MCVNFITYQVLFKQLAIDKSDLFLLAAQGVCLIISRIIDDGMNQEEAKKPFEMLHQR